MYSKVLMTFLWFRMMEIPFAYSQLAKYTRIWSL